MVGLYISEPYDCAFAFMHLVTQAKAWGYFILHWGRIQLPLRLCVFAVNHFFSPHFVDSDQYNALFHERTMNTLNKYVQRTIGLS